MSEEQSEEIRTQVTSVAKEREKGNNIEVPTAEELVHNASQSFISNKRMLNQLISNKTNTGTKKLGSKALIRVINAILDLPTEDIPVYLKSNEEKTAFMLGQKIINDRFVMTQYYVTQEALKNKKLNSKREEQEKIVEEAKENGATEKELQTLTEKHKIEYTELKKSLEEKN